MDELLCYSQDDLELKNALDHYNKYVKYLLNKHGNNITVKKNNNRKRISVVTIGIIKSFTENNEE
jgi:hypothetical protein